MPLIDPPTGHLKERELEAIHNILENTSTIYDYVLRDLNKGKIIKSRRQRVRFQGKADLRRTRKAYLAKPPLASGMIAFLYTLKYWRATDGQS